MKLLKIMSAVVASMLVVCINVSAKSNVKFYQSVLNDSEYLFVVEGYIPSGEENKDVNVLILNPECKLEDVTEGYTQGIIKYQENIITSTNGYFRVETTVNESDAHGTYNCYIGGMGFPALERTDGIYFADNTEKASRIKAMKESATKDMLMKELSDSEMILALNDEIYLKADKDELSKLIFNNKNMLDENNSVLSIKNIYKLAIVAAYNKSEIETVYQNGKFLNTNIIDFSSVDSDGADIYKEVFSNILNESGKNQLINSLMGKGFDNDSELLKTFKENTVMLAIKNAKTSGNGHIEKILTKENSNSCSLNIPTYLSLKTDRERSAANLNIANSNYKNIAELTVCIENAAKNALNANTNNDFGNGGGNGGGSAGGSNKGGAYNIIVSNPDNLPAEVVDNSALSAKPFVDMDNAKWAEEAVIYLYERSIVNGMGNNMFMPNNNVTREQFLVMIMRAANIELSDSENDFKDVVSGSYYEKYVNTAKKLGIVNGMSENEFGVGKTLIRQDMAVIVNNVINVCGTKTETIKSVDFSDKDSIAKYAEGSVDVLARAGVINGFEDNTFRPYELCTRAQTAKIIYELLKGAVIK